jgi:hypothetical protein
MTFVMLGKIFQALYGTFSKVAGTFEVRKRSKDASFFKGQEGHEEEPYQSLGNSAESASKNVPPEIFKRTGR